MEAIRQLLEVAVGSVTGTDHIRTGKNNHDAHVVLWGEKTLVALVADGCGSGAHSEVGAKIGVRLIAEQLLSFLENGRAHEKYSIQQLTDEESHLWQTVRKRTLTKLEELARLMGGSYSQTVEDYFLFTVVGIVVAHGHVTYFALGDGLVIENGEIVYQGEFENNAPPYLAYGGMVKTTLGTADQYRFRVLRSTPLEEFEYALVATDGANDLLEVENEYMPGSEETVGPISCLWTEDRYFHNPDMLRRRLALCNRDIVSIDAEGNILRAHRLLPDDTTIITLRKRAEV